MISAVVVISYDNDSQLGSYFSDCADYAIKFLNSPEITSITINEVSDSQCNSAYFDTKILPIVSQQNTLLVIYSHGNDDAFLYQGIPFIKSNINSNNIGNTVIYTNACSTGKVFGKAISASGGVFIGYESDISIFTDPYYRRHFIECDNWGLFLLFYKQLELVSLRQAVKDKFNQHIDELYKINGKGFFIAGFLQEARDSFVVLGQNLNRTLI